MSDRLAAAEDQLIQALAAAGRRSERNGAYALWLFVRACGGVLPPDRLSPRNQRRRLQRLERRLGILPLPSPLRRALAGGMRGLADAVPHAAAVALQQLVAPARENVGPEAADALALAARAARDASREAKSS